MMMAEQFWAERTHSQALFATGADSLSWQQAMQQITALGQYLSDQSVKRAGLYFDDAAYFAIALLACVQADIDVYLPANLSDDNCLWLEQTVDIYLADEITNKLAIPALPASRWAELGCAEANCHFVNNIAVVLQTSGSTGAAKLINKNWHELCLEAQILAATLPGAMIQDRPVVLGSVSVQHMYGLSFRIMLSLYLGLPVYRQRLLFPEVLLVTSQTYRNVIWVSSPTLLHTLRLSHDISLAQGHVVAVISAGGVLAQTSKAFLLEHICPNVVEIYGSTETGAVGYRSDQPHWQFFQDVSHRVEENGLAILSPRCTTEQILADAIVEYENGFELLGRLDRIIKLADKRISLMQLENKLMAHEWVADIHILKHPEGTHLAAWVALNDAGIQAWGEQGRKQVILELKECLAGSQEKIALPRHWRFTTALPRNAQSKLNPADIQQAILQPVTHPIVLDQKAVADDEYRLRIQVPLDLVYFRGHFDVFHLVPGVIQIKWIIELLQQCSWLVQAPLQMENLKFQHFLRPADIVELVFKRDCIRRKISFQCFMHDKKISSGRLVIPDSESHAL
ncbi:AMP-binding protein [Snodgrassella sp. ESL0253]|uniref:AMP-binding protein n=1 Tax=Snodgrassella sp. ESL0253 TaxID=2705031 RepID=UPI001581D169|nr:AMP-binding protein [Snodgrassella sp. ESL0253]NUE67446.1 AMP-binding protein [Snodgrassella sp. ESL0253]